jgi:hypothetical protein
MSDLRKAAEQEPVAWMETKNFLTFRQELVQRKIFNTSGQGVPLFTAPPQRKPLTDELIDILASAMVKGDKSVNWLCRVIEAKHGIGEKNE